MRSGHAARPSIRAARRTAAPVGVISELANDDGTESWPASRSRISQKARSEADLGGELIPYRQAREKLVERVAGQAGESFVGEMTLYCYDAASVRCDSRSYTARSATAASDRPASTAPTSSAISAGDLLRRTLERFKREGRGVLVYMRDGTAGVPANVSRRADAVPRQTLRALARRRPRRADPQGPRRALDRAAHPRRP